jgi:hypothetical protein
LEALIERTVQDVGFRRRLLADPEGVTRAEGYKIDSETLAQLGKLGELPPGTIEDIINITRDVTRKGGAAM